MPNPAIHCRHTRTGTFVRWEITVAYSRYKFVTVSLFETVMIYITAVSLLQLPHGRFRSETAGRKPTRRLQKRNGYNRPFGHKRPFGCSSYVMAVAAGKSRRFYSCVGIFNWYYLSSPLQVLRFPTARLG
jgi:hypothetical protein